MSGGFSPAISLLALHAEGRFDAIARLRAMKARMNAQLARLASCPDLFRLFRLFRRS
jgi:hypothetical protein